MQLARIWRSLVALAVVPWLICASVMPREHLHEADGDHPQALIHWHAEAHGSESHHADDADIDHDEGRVVWLSDAAVVPHTHHFSLSWAILAPAFDPFDETLAWVASVSRDTSPPHGPPRPSSSPRAPPARFTI